MTNVLTARALQAIKPHKVRREIPDAYLRGLYFIVQPSGVKSWAIRYRHGRRTRKHTLGSYPAIDLKSARVLAAKALRAVAEGRDPAMHAILGQTLVSMRHLPGESSPAKARNQGCRREIGNQYYTRRGPHCCGYRPSLRSVLDRRRRDCRR
jgi:hypothetical protein